MLKANRAQYFAKRSVRTERPVHRATVPKKPTVGQGASRRSFLPLVPWRLGIAVPASLLSTADEVIE